MNPYESPPDLAALSATKWTLRRVFYIGLVLFVASGFIIPAFSTAKHFGPCRIGKHRDSTVVNEPESEAVPNYKCTPTEDEMPQPPANP